MLKSKILYKLNTSLFILSFYTILCPLDELFLDNSFL